MSEEGAFTLRAKKYEALLITMGKGTAIYPSQAKKEFEEIQQGGKKRETRNKQKINDTVADLSADIITLNVSGLNIMKLKSSQSMG